MQKEFLNENSKYIYDFTLFYMNHLNHDINPRAQGFLKELMSPLNRIQHEEKSIQHSYWTYATRSLFHPDEIPGENPFRTL